MNNHDKYYTLMNARHNEILNEEINNVSNYSFLKHPETPEKLYKYMTLNKFVYMMESENLFLNNLSIWDDKYEVPEAKLPFYVEQGSWISEKREFENHKMTEFGEASRIKNPVYPEKKFIDFLYGTCFTTLANSDAMWRIYSEKNNGIKICVDSRKFSKLQGDILWEVYYYDNLIDGIKSRDSEMRKVNINLLRRGFLKRKNFEHENEYRLVKVNSGSDDYLGVTFKLSEFIISIEVDPRSDTWFYELVHDYCKRRLKTVEVSKSKLYNNDVYNDTGCSIVYDVFST